VRNSDEPGQEVARNSVARNSVARNSVARNSVARNSVARNSARVDSAAGHNVRNPDCDTAGLAVAGRTPALAVVAQTATAVAVIAVGLPKDSVRQRSEGS
jgi:hypothetical protein